MSHPDRSRSNTWFLLPICFGIVGGIIAFFVLRQDDAQKARNCLYLGIIFMIIGIVVNMLLAMSFPSVDSGFNVNI